MDAPSLFYILIQEKEIGKKAENFVHQGERRTLLKGLKDMLFAPFRLYPFLPSVDKGFKISSERGRFFFAEAKESVDVVHIKKLKSNFGTSFSAVTTTALCAALSAHQRNTQVKLPAPFRVSSTVPMPGRERRSVDNYLYVLHVTQIKFVDNHFIFVALMSCTTSR